VSRCCILATCSRAEALSSFEGAAVEELERALRDGDPSGRPAIWSHIPPVTSTALQAAIEDAHRAGAPGVVAEVRVDNQVWRGTSGVADELNAAGVPVVADNGYHGAGPIVRVPQRRRRLDPDTGRYRRLSRSQKLVNAGRCPPARPERAGERSAQELEDPARDPLLPISSHQPGQRRPGPHPGQLTPSGKSSMSP
jgi:hypothetical protein